MPELSRSESFDSQASNDPLSPLTPATEYSFPRPAQYTINQAYTVDPTVAKRPAFAESRTTSYVGEETPATSPLPEQRQGKRYPCRYRETHGCEKTFTTSGHASRHSKIHTAEKAVQCSFPLCQKKFTRADNMKQHLETHFKDRARGAASAQRAQQRMAARNRPVARESQASTTRSWEPTEQRPLPSPPLASPNGTGATWDMSGLNLPLLSRPVAARTPSSGLDALAMAIAHQEEVA
ncbi:uncharacterized protein J7T54_006197 [Emericellopsis cladophorae]|uniref:C2H2 type master regulator of conidiophore development brlA n=1 Tax=Emericellopsis cladophorae TaxID=2686198 RepID=A0A9P9Y9X5_9HYPO|nr:uncharacterized protein J7T54_006197 [Emericellopsis cladophorae]KAI6785858.1 hypothetical protein J7T54_006197 [Emericellopsis cladophorae]